MEQACIDEESVTMTCRMLPSAVLVMFLCGALTAVLGLDSSLTDSCYDIYQTALGNKSNIDFSQPIGQLTCSGGTDFHCLMDDNQRQIELCIETIFMEPGLCPTFVSYNSKIHYKKCNISSPGCPTQAYRSRDFYEYTDCLDQLLPPVEEKTTSKTTTISIEPSSKTITAENGERNGVSVAAIVVPPLLVIILICCAVLVYKYRRKLGWLTVCKKDSNQETVLKMEEAKDLLKEHDNTAPEKESEPQLDNKLLLKQLVDNAGTDVIGTLVKEGDAEMSSFIRKAETAIYMPRVKAQMTATRCLTSDHYVIVTGGQGSGRRTLGKEMLLNYMYQQYTPVLVHDTQYLSLIMNCDRKYAVLFDTVELNPGNEEDSFYTETLTKLKDCPDVVMIVIVKIGDYTRLKGMSKIKDGMVVDLSAKTYQMTEYDKKELLKKHCKARSIEICKSVEDESLESEPWKISKDTINKIAALDIEKGFPKACDIFFSDHRVFRKGIDHFKGMQTH